MIGKSQIINKNDINMKIMTSSIYYEFCSLTQSTRLNFVFLVGFSLTIFYSFFFPDLFNGYWYLYVEYLTDAIMFIRQQQKSLCLIRKVKLLQAS